MQCSVSYARKKQVDYTLQQTHLFFHSLVVPPGFYIAISREEITSFCLYLTAVSEGKPNHEAFNRLLWILEPLFHSVHNLYATWDMHVLCMLLLIWNNFAYRCHRGKHNFMHLFIKTVVTKSPSKRIYATNIIICLSEIIISMCKEFIAKWEII